MADAIKNNIENAEIDFIKGKGGVFEVKKDGKLIYSKAQTGVFPDEEELVNQLK